MAGAPIYIVHLSCNEALEKVREARDRGLPVYAETCPQYLYLSIENFDVPDFEGAKYVFTPPLREKWHQEKLWNGLKQDHLQVVSTDHCPFCFKEQKELGRDDFTKIPNGGPGIEHRMSLIYSGGVAQGRFSVNRFVELVSTTPAKLFGLYPRKGTIAIGSDADLVVFDPKRKHTISAQTHHMRVDYSMFEGIQVMGMPDIVLSRGRVVVEGRQVSRPCRTGRFFEVDLFPGERVVRGSAAYACGLHRRVQLHTFRLRHASRRTDVHTVEFEPLRFDDDHERGLLGFLGKHL